MQKKQKKTFGLTYVNRFISYYVALPRFCWLMYNVIQRSKDSSQIITIYVHIYIRYVMSVINCSTYQWFTSMHNLYNTYSNDTLPAYYI